MITVKYQKILLLLLLPLFIFSCKDDEINLITSILPDDDLVALKSDTFHLDASTIDIDKIPLKSGNSSLTLLFGTHTDKLFGVTRAEVLAQFNCPAYNWALPPDTISTQLILFVKYNGYFAKVGDSITIKAYEMNNATFNTPPSSTTYYSNIDPILYSDTTTADLLGSVKIRIRNNSKDSITVCPIVLSNDFKNKLINASISNKGVYSDKLAFVQFFKGIYLTAESDSSSMLIISNNNDLEMDLISTYKPYSTILTDVKVFPASKEVRQVNRITHDYLSDPMYVPANDSVVYVNSPAGKDVQITIPLKRIKDRLGVKDSLGIAYVGSKKLSINHSLLKLEVSDVIKSSMPKPAYLLLIKKSMKDDFFKTSGRTDNRTSIVAAYDAVTKSYSFDLKYYLADEFKKSTMNTTDELEIVPVSVVENTDKSISVSHSLGLYGASLRTKTNVSPLKLSVLISAF